MLQVETITQFSALEALAPEWSLLWERSPEATPFQAPEWLLPWWMNFGGGPLRVLALRRDGRLAALAPLFLHQWPDGRARRISWIGSGISDHLDLIAESRISEEAAGIFFRTFRESQADWDLLDLQDLGPGSPLLKNSGGSGLRFKAFSAGVSPILPLPSSIDSFHSGLTRVKKRNLSRARKGLEGSGKMHFQIAAENGLSSALEDLFRLHRACWEKRNSPGMLADGKVQDFHRRVAASFLRRGALRLYGLELNGKTVASLYILVKGDRAYAYLSGFDPRLEKLSPGSVLLHYALEDSIRRGLREFDFLRGAEPYKYEWGARDVPQKRLILWRSAAGVRIGEEGGVFFEEERNGLEREIPEL